MRNTANSEIFLLPSLLCCRFSDTFCREWNFDMDIFSDSRITPWFFYWLLIDIIRFLTLLAVNSERSFILLSVESLLISRVSGIGYIFEPYFLAAASYYWLNNSSPAISSLKYLILSRNFTILSFSSKNLTKITPTMHNRIIKMQKYKIVNQYRIQLF